MTLASKLTWEPQAAHDGVGVGKGLGGVLFSVDRYNGHVQAGLARRRSLGPIGLAIKSSCVCLLRLLHMMVQVQACRHNRGGRVLQVLLTFQGAVAHPPRGITPLAATGAVPKIPCSSCSSMQRALQPVAWLVGGCSVVVALSPHGHQLQLLILALVNGVVLGGLVIEGHVGIEVLIPCRQTLGCGGDHLEGRLVGVIASRSSWRVHIQMQCIIHNIDKMVG